MDLAEDIEMELNRDSDTEEDLSDSSDDGAVSEKDLESSSHSEGESSGNESPVAGPSSAPDPPSGAEGPPVAGPSSAGLDQPTAETMGEGSRRRAPRPRRGRVARPTPIIAPCKKDCVRQCSTSWTEAQRMLAREMYQALPDKQAQKQFLLNCMKLTKEAGPGGRKSWEYQMRKGQGEEPVAVCKAFLMSTFCVSDKTLRYTRDNANQGLVKKDHRGGVRNSKDAKRNELRQWIEKLPALLPHYTRKDSRRKYLPSYFKNLHQVYLMYSKGVAVPLSESAFKKTWKTEYNIGVHVPRKDKCLTCEKFKNGRVSEEVNQHHQAEKEAVNAYFQELQAKVKQGEDKGVVVASFDLEKVLGTPHGKSMLIGYSRKLAVYNFTIYESGTKKVLCYVWNETEAGRGSNEITSCVLDYLKRKDLEEVNSVYLACDSCFGQNRNKTMLAMIHSFVQHAEHLKSVEVLFLVSGHTYMPCDSVHSAVERAAKDITVFAPSQWTSLIVGARAEEPYEVVKLTRDKVFDYKAIANTVVPPKVPFAKVRAFCSLAGERSQIFIKKNITESWTLCEWTRRRGRTCFPTPALAYKAKLKISEAKYRDLMKLCDTGVIPEIFHQEYEGLQPTQDRPDNLDETDEEEEAFSDDDD